MRTLVAMTKGAFDPASRFRLVQWAPHLEREGWKVDHRPCRPDVMWSSSLSGRWLRALHHRAGRAARWLHRWGDIEDACRADAVFVNRNLAGRGRLLEQRLLSRCPRVIFDFDDAIFVGPGAGVAELMCRRAAWVTAGNDYLASWASRYNAHVSVLPTVIDTDTYLQLEPRAEGPVRIGWSGSDGSMRATLFPYLELLHDLQRYLPFELVIVSNTMPVLPVDGIDWHFHPWRAEDEFRLGEKFDIGLMPLVDDEFQRGKCGLKLLQYMAAGLPTIASPVGVNRQITVEGETGYLANTPAQWRSAIEILMTDVPRRRAMGAAGRHRCCRHYSIRRWLPQWLSVLERAASTGNQPLTLQEGV